MINILSNLSNENNDSLAKENLVNSVGQSIRNFVISEHEYDLTEIRCKQCGSLVRKLTNQELYNIYLSSGYDLVKTSERLESYIVYGTVSLAHWLFINTEQLETNRQESPLEFMMFSIKSLAETSKQYFDMRNKLTGRLTSEGKFFTLIEFFRFAQKVYSLGLDNSLIDLINEKLVLINSVTNLAVAEDFDIYNLSTYDNIYSMLTSGNLIENLNQFIELLIYRFNLKNKTSLTGKVTFESLEKLQSKIKNQANQDMIAKINANKIFIDMKRAKDPTGYIDNILGELSLHNQSNFKIELSTRQALDKVERLKQGLIKIKLGKNEISSEEFANKKSTPVITKLNFKPREEKANLPAVIYTTEIVVSNNN